MNINRETPMAATITRKRKILFFIPFALVAVMLVYSWLTFMVTDNIASWAHYLGLLLFLPLIYLFRNRTFKKLVVLFGVYLILATMNLLSFLPYTLTNSFGIAIASFKIFTPAFNGVAFLSLMLYGILNFDTLADIYLDYREAKGKL